MMVAVGTPCEEEEDDEKEAKGRERSETAEESGEGASEAGGLVGGGVKVIWMPCVPTVQSRYDVASSKSVRSDILASAPTTIHTAHMGDTASDTHTQKSVKVKPAPTNPPAKKKMMVRMVRKRADHSERGGG